MSMNDKLGKQISRGLTIMDRIQAKMNQVKELGLKESLDCGDIHIRVRGGDIYIDCPKDTKVHAECWYTYDTKMSEDFVIGTDQHAYFIKRLQDMEEEVDKLIKRCK